jgi:hypothetical protein
MPLSDRDHASKSAAPRQNRGPARATESAQPEAAMATTVAMTEEEMRAKRINSAEDEHEGADRQEGVHELRHAQTSSAGRARYYTCARGETRIKPL